MSKTVLSKEILKIIEASVNEAVMKTIIELKQSKQMKENTMTAYQKTERMLYDFKKYEQAIKDKLEKIETIKTHGIPKKSGSVIIPVEGTKQVLLEEIKRQEAIEELEASIELTQRYVAIVKEALEKLTSDPYYDIIEQVFFEQVSCEKVADYFGVDVSTIYRNRNRLIRELSIKLFSDDVIKELLCA